MRWVGDPDAEEPAATITVDEAEDDHHATPDDAAADDVEDAEADEVATDDTEDDDDDSDGMTIAALALGGLGVLLGGASLARSRKS